MTIEADRDVDARYGHMRGRFGGARPEANGYRLQAFFRREQRVLLAALQRETGPILDAASGSGLMLGPLVRQGRPVLGLDFNAEACAAAKGNGLLTIRGDAFNLPLADESIGQIVNCQFLNQQPSDRSRVFIGECARVLKSGGQLIVLWRHAESLIHRAAHMGFSILDRVSKRPRFPQYVHPMQEIKAFAEESGLEVQREAVTLPFLKADILCADSVWAGVVGASLFIVLRKP